MPHMICPKCGKQHYRIDFVDYVYKDYKGFYCSWTCYNHKDDDKFKKGPRKVEMWSLEGGEVLRVFKNAEDASRQTGYNAFDIREACRTGEPYRGFIWMYRE